MKNRSYRIPPATVKRVRTRILTWYQRNGRHTLPWRLTRDPYRITVAEIMLQQTQVARVVPKYRQFIRVYPTLPQLARAGRSRLLRVWSGLGYNRRALRLKALAQTVLRDYGGQIPDTAEELIKLPGLGPYASRAIAIFAFNRDEITIDTNVRRIFIHELQLPLSVGTKDLETVAWQLLPLGRSRQWHSALMDYGAMAATARITGIKSLGSKQPYVDSSRYYRGQIVQQLLRYGRLTTRQLAGQLGLELDQTQQLVAGLAKDGLVVVKGGSVMLPR